MLYYDVFDCCMCALCVAYCICFISCLCVVCRKRLLIVFVLLFWCCVLYVCIVFEWCVRVVPCVCVLHVCVLLLRVMYCVYCFRMFTLRAVSPCRLLFALFGVTVLLHLLLGLASFVLRCACFMCVCLLLCLFYVCFVLLGCLWSCTLRLLRARVLFTVAACML